MKKIKAKPCKCGDNRRICIKQFVGIGWLCLIGCMDINCDAEVIRFGLTKNHAVQRAIWAWNRRMTNG